MFYWLVVLEPQKLNKLDKPELIATENCIHQWVKMSIAPYKSIIKGRQVPGAQES